jgi:hypothetical protein
MDRVLDQPALVDQFLDQQADRRARQAAALGQVGTRQARFAAQQAQQGHAVHALDEVLIAGDGWRSHGTALSLRASG